MLDLLHSIPPLVICLVVGLVVGVESLGIPVPGEIVLVSATLAASQGLVDPVHVAAAAALGASVGDSVGYAIGRRGGRPLLTWLGRKFPKHFNAQTVASTERQFARWGMWAVFFGRFVALLRIMAGPLAGVLRMPYLRFLTANVLGAVVWAGTTTTVIYFFGLLAEQWLKRFSWIGLLAALATSGVTILLMRRKAKAHAAPAETAEDASRPKEVVPRHQSDA